MNKPSKKPTANENEAIESAQSCIADGITLGSRGLLADAIEAFEKALSAFRFERATDSLWTIAHSR